MHALKDIYERHLPRLEQAIHEFPWEDQLAYSMFLAQTYFYVVHSTKLLLEASKLSQNKKLSSHLLRHKKEETGHDKWAKSDLEHLGGDPADYPMFDETKNVYESIYQEIKTVGPAAIMGYAMALEGMSARTLPAIYQRLLKVYDKKACSFIKGHADADPHHIIEGFKSAELLGPNEQKEWGRVFIDSVDRYVSYLYKIKQEATRAAKKTA